MLTNPVSGEGLRVVNAKSSSFSSEITKLLSADARVKASPFLPWSFVIVNGTGRYIWGFTFIYIFPDSLAPSGAPRQIRISPSPGGPAPRESLLSPGSEYLITPGIDFFAAIDANGVRVRAPILDDQMDRMIGAFLSRHTNVNERVQAYVDSLIYEDGTIVGPDTAGAQTEVNDMIRADHDLVASLANLKGEGLRSHLSNMHPANWSRDAYAFRHDAVASALQGIYSREGEDGLRKRLETMNLNDWFPNHGCVRRRPE